MGDPDGQFNLGLAYDANNGVPLLTAADRLDEAVRLFRLAAAQGHEGARLALRGGSSSLVAWRWSSRTPRRGRRRPWRP